VNNRDPFGLECTNTQASRGECAIGLPGVSTADGRDHFADHAAWSGAMAWGTGRGRALLAGGVGGGGSRRGGFTPTSTNPAPGVFLPGHSDAMESPAWYADLVGLFLPAGRLQNVGVKFAWERAGHVFLNKAGHVNPATRASRQRFARLFEAVANNPNNLRSSGLPPAAIAAGEQLYTQTFRNGQVWVRVHRGVIKSAGVNPPGRYR
jgi:hypothetical protein